MIGTEMIELPDVMLKRMPRLLPEMLRAFADTVETKPSDTAAAYMRLAAEEIETLRENQK
jgi:hypothetical protein